MIREGSFHRGSHPQCLMDTAEIVIGLVDRNHVTVLFDLLRERIQDSPLPEFPVIHRPDVTSVTAPTFQTG
jgi:hypothetical protein